MSKIKEKITLIAAEDFLEDLEERLIEIVNQLDEKRRQEFLELIERKFTETLEDFKIEVRAVSVGLLGSLEDREEKIVSEILSRLPKEELAEMAAKKIPKPKDGKDVKPEEIAPFVMKSLKLGDFRTIARGLEILDGEDRLDFFALKNKPSEIRQPVFAGGGGGGGGSSIEPAFQLDGTANGANAAFTVSLTRPNVAENTEMVFLNGLLQFRGSGNDYTISLTPNGGSGVKATITFVDAPSLNSNILITYHHG